MKPLASIAAVVLSTALASAVNAQTAPATASPDAPAGIERPTTAAPTDPVEAFLERTAERQRIREAALSRRGANALVAQLRPLLANARIAPNGLGRNPQMRARLESALNVEVIQLLAAAGLRPADILRNRARGVDVFEAASAAIRGEATFQQQAALAQSIVVAEALDQRQTSAGDGFGSTVRFRVVDRLKGDLSPGAEFALRQQSTETMDVSTDLRPAAGEQFLLLLSRDYYQQLVAEAGRQGQDAAYAQIMPGYLVSPEGLMPTVIGQPRLSSIEEARNAAH